MPHLHDLRGRLFCDSCFGTVNAKLKERGLTIDAPSAVAAPPPATVTAPVVTAAPVIVEASPQQSPVFTRATSVSQRGSAPGVGWARARPSGGLASPTVAAEPASTPIPAAKVEGNIVLHLEPSFPDPSLSPLTLVRDGPLQHVQE